MKNSVSRRFAKALMEIGREEGAYEAYGKELRTVLGVFKGTPELMKVLLNPMYKLDERLSLMGKVSESLKLSRNVSRFLNILVETRNIRQIEGVVEAYSKMEDDLSGRVRAIVESSTDIAGALADEIKKKISSSTGKEAAVAFRKRPELLGGLVVRIGNTVLDGSLKTQLELMREKIIEGVV